MTDEQIKEAIQEIVNHCSQLTLQLVRLSAAREPIGVASGFLVSVDGANYLISAGHALGQNGWAIETCFTVEENGITACIPLNGPWTLKKFTTNAPKLRDMDIAWAKVDLESFQSSLRKDKRIKGRSFEYLVYQGPLEDLPDPTQPHVYASANRVLLIDSPKGKYLERSSSYEFEMEYKGINGHGLYVFSIPKHKGHDYYRGASGSPIVELSGKVVAILVQGCESKNELYGYPTKGIVDLIRIGTDAESRESKQRSVARR